jgi:SAM-dependent methyltransferase
VPLDPWRVYELSHLATLPFPGRWLDIASPKLLPSYCGRRGEGEWVCTDLHSDELAAWNVIDPQLLLQQEDARSLSFPDSAFDGCLCVSVVEHIPDDGDVRAMAEMWRVLKPGGRVRLTTNISRRPRHVFINRRVYGEASEASRSGRVFFERHYDDHRLRERLLELPWEIVRQERVRQRRPGIERRFFQMRPWSYAAGNALPTLCARNFIAIFSTDELGDDEMGIVSLELRKPVG